jgi:hypothetical protein
MAAYVVQTTKDSATPNLEVYESLVGARDHKPIARIGWSYRNDLDLRELAAARDKKGWKKGKKKGWEDAWKCWQFLENVEKGDLLFYRNLPAQGRFALVEVTGDYGYRKAKGDFRSYRPCKVLAESVKLSDPVVGTKLRTHINLKGRLWKIKTKNVAENFLQRLKAGKRGGNGKPPESNGAPGRGASQLEQMKKRFSYVIGRGERKVNLFHLKYQMRLEEFLKAKSLSPLFEKDYIDVQFSLGSNHFIGEVKVTNWLSINEAFRIALGQILDYAHTRRTDKPGLVIFLDKNVDEKRRIDLATTLGIAVVVERKKSDYVVLNPGVSESLASLFAPSSP